MDESSGRPMAARGAAWRRRQRRLRSMLRHERQTVAVALAECLHHSAQPLEKARAREVEEQDQNEALRRQKAPPPGKRPGVLKDPEPQGRFGQHCGVGFELVQALDVPVLQMVEQPVEVLSFLRSSLSAVPEQVIEVPILSLLVCAVQRAVPLEPQMAEQLVEVPTPFFFFEQNADIPVPHRLGGHRLQGFHPVQSSTASASQIVDIPTSGGSYGFLPRQGSAASAAENVDFPAGGGLHGLRRGQGFAAFSGPEHGHDAPRRSRRGGGSVGGPQGSVPGQSSSARGRARHRRFAGRLFILLGPSGCGFIESSAEAEFGRAAFGGFRVPVSWQGHFAADASVTFSVWKGPDGFMDDIEAVGRG